MKTPHLLRRVRGKPGWITEKFPFRREGAKGVSRSFLEIQKGLVLPDQRSFVAVRLKLKERLNWIASKGESPILSPEFPQNLSTHKQRNFPSREQVHSDFSLSFGWDSLRFFKRFSLSQHLQKVSLSLIQSFSIQKCNFAKHLWEEVIVTICHKCSEKWS